MNSLLKGSSENLSDSRILDFIGIGSKEDFAGLEEWITIDRDAPPGNRCIFQIDWQARELAENLDDEQISAIVRALVAADMKDLYFSGSTTGVHKYLMMLRSRGWAGTDELEEWVFANAKNGYISFPPVLGVKPKSLREYYQLREAKIASHQKMQKEGRARRVQAGLDRFESQRLAQKKRSIKRNETLLQLAGLTPFERLNAIILDIEHSPYYYPPSLLEYCDQEWLSFPVENTKILLEKLKFPPRGHWRNLAKHLQALVNHQQRENR